MIYQEDVLYTTIVYTCLAAGNTETYYHGAGTLIVGDIAKKYEGIYDVYEESGFFCCNVLLNKNL